VNTLILFATFKVNKTVTGVADKDLVTGFPAAMKLEALTIPEGTTTMVAENGLRGLALLFITITKTTLAFTMMPTLGAVGNFTVVAVVGAHQETFEGCDQVKVGFSIPVNKDLLHFGCLGSRMAGDNRVSVALGDNNNLIFWKGAFLELVDVIQTVLMANSHSMIRDKLFDESSKASSA